MIKNGFGKTDASQVSLEEVEFIATVAVDGEYSEVQVEMDRQGVTLEDEAGLWPMVHTLRYDIEKARAYRVLPLYLFLLATITSIPWMSRLSNERYNELFHLEKANEDEFLNTRFNNISDVPTFWGWFGAVTSQVFAPRPSTGRLSRVSNFPVGYLLLRQFRVRPGPCVVPSIVRGTMHLDFPDQCYGEWKDNNRASDPYGPPNDPWVAGSELDVLSINTMFHTYTNPKDAYTMMFPLSMTEDEALNNITRLSDYEWVDAATRVVIIDIVTFNPAIDAFALNHYYIEFFATGSVVAGLKAYPFEILHFTSHSSRYVFVADVIMVLLTAQLTAGLVVTIYRRRQMKYDMWASMFDFYDVMFIVILAHGCYYRMLLWRDGPDLHGGDPPADDKIMYTKLFNYGFRYERANTYVGIAVVFAWIRLFRFLQYNSRLGVLSETLSKAKADLVAMFIILIIVLIGYGIGGSAIYGVDHKNFSSWPVAMAYLLRLLISSEVDQYYDELKAIHPNWTGFYVATFMIITWVILLNMVLAVITGAFVSVQENKKAKEDQVWSVGSLKKDAKNYCDRFPIPFVHSSDYCDARLYLVLHLVQLAKEMEAKEGLSRRMMFISLRDWFDASRPVIPVELALRMFLRGKIQTRVPEMTRNIARSVNGLSMQVDKVQNTMFRVGVKIDKMAANSQAGDNVSVLMPTTTVATQTDLPSFTPLSGGNYIVRRRQTTVSNEASSPSSTKLSRSNWSDEDQAPLLHQGRRKGHRDREKEKDMTRRKASYPSAALQCKSQGCPNIIDHVGVECCYDHLCPRCQGLKSTKHQPLCARCELSNNSHSRILEYGRKRFSLDSQGFPSTRRHPEDPSASNDSTIDTTRQTSNPLIPYTFTGQ